MKFIQSVIDDQPIEKKSEQCCRCEFLDTFLDLLKFIFTMNNDYLHSLKALDLATTCAAKLRSLVFRGEN